MLKELFEKGYINYEKLIIDNAKALSLKTGEILVLFKIIEQALAKKTLNVTEIRESLVISKPKLDACLARLMERSFYEIYISYENGEGYEYISLDTLYDKLNAILAKDFIPSDDLAKSNQVLQKALNRVLTASELDILATLINDDRKTLTDIEDAIEYLKSINRNITMKSLVQALNKEFEVKKTEVSSSVKSFIKSVK